MAIQRDMKLLTASDVAELCEVDLKTIHNWVERGCIPHFRTPGRHLRFQASDIALFLKEWGYSIPRKLYARIAQAAVVVGSKDQAALVSRVVAPTVTVHQYDDLYDALIMLGVEPTCVVVFELEHIKHDADALVQAMGAVARAFPQMPIVLAASEQSVPDDIPDVVRVPPGESKPLRLAVNTERQPQDIPTTPIRPRRRPRPIRPS